MSDDWASRTAARMKQQRDTQKLEGERSSQERGMITSQASMLWEDLRATINSNAEKLNEIEQGTCLVVSPLVSGRVDHKIESAQAVLNAGFDDSVPRISFTIAKKPTTPYTPNNAPSKPSGGDLMFQVDRGEVWFVNKKNPGVFLSVDQTAEFFLDLALGPH